jgi:hypothetical protein
VILGETIVPHNTRLGGFPVLDFSAINVPGRYSLAINDSVVGQVSIAKNPWTPSMWKALNFFYGERCGFDVPGA